MFWFVLWIGLMIFDIEFPSYYEPPKPPPISPGWDSDGGYGLSSADMIATISGSL